jgi:hypothetical protein
VATKRLFVVYQMGKVASAAIAETLAAIDGAEVAHCHYLSRHTLEESLANALKLDLSDETYWHTSRQLLANLDVHRRLRRIEAELETGVEPCVITLAREPLAWTRSALVQNLPAHEPVLRRLCAVHGVPIDDQGGWLQWAIARTVAGVGRLCETAGTVVQAVNRSREQIQDRLECSSEEATCIQRMTGIFRRPHEWFVKEFLPFTGLSLGCLEEVAPRVWFGRMGVGSVYVIRYEDLPVSFDTVMDAIGLSHVRLDRFANVSDDKPGAEAARKAFAETPFRAVLEAASATSYTRFFGYTSAREATAASLV